MTPPPVGQRGFSYHESVNTFKGDRVACLPAAPCLAQAGRRPFGFPGFAAGGNPCARVLVRARIGRRQGSWLCVARRQAHPRPNHFEKPSAEDSKKRGMPLLRPRQWINLDHPPTVDTTANKSPSLCFAPHATPPRSSCGGFPPPVAQFCFPRSKQENGRSEGTL